MGGCAAQAPSARPGVPGRWPSSDASARGLVSVPSCLGISMALCPVAKCGRKMAVSNMKLLYPISIYFDLIAPISDPLPPLSFFGGEAACTECPAWQPFSRSRAVKPFERLGKPRKEFGVAEGRAATKRAGPSESTQARSRLVKGFSEKKRLFIFF